MNYSSRSLSMTEPLPKRSRSATDAPVRSILLRLGNGGDGDRQECEVKPQELQDELGKWLRMQLSMPAPSEMALHQTVLVTRMTGEIRVDS